MHHITLDEISMMRFAYPIDKLQEIFFHFHNLVRVVAGTVTDSLISLLELDDLMDKIKFVIS